MNKGVLAFMERESGVPIGLGVEFLCSLLFYTTNDKCAAHTVNLLHTYFLVEILCQTAVV